MCIFPNKSREWGKSRGAGSRGKRGNFSPESCPLLPFNMGWLQKFDFFSKITENSLHLRYAGFERLNSSDFQKAES
jgi:hypothetical protein